MNKKGEETFQVLFVGIMDVISVSLADRLNREGSSIFWLTPQQASYAYQHVPARVYRRALTREAIRSMLRMHDIDTVVFHYGSYQETEETVEESCIPALCTLLEVLYEHKIRHFLYLSADDLTYFSQTPRVAELRLAETLVSYYAQSGSLPAIILRLGMVYGKGDACGMGYIGRLIEELREGHDLECRCYPDSLVDPVFAGDVAMAAYKLLLCDVQGTYYVYTGRPITMSKLHQTISRMMEKPLYVTYLEKEETLTEEDMLRLSLPLREATGWMPMYLFDELGKERLREAVESAAQDVRKASKEYKPRKHFLKLSGKQRRYLRALTEVLGLFTITQALLPYVHDSADLRFVDLRLLFVMLAALRYGMGGGLVSVVLASVSYTLALHQMGIDMSYLLYSVENWIPFIVYGVCGVAIGYSADRRNDMLEEAGEKYDSLFERYDFLLSLHTEVLEVKRGLQRQLSSSRESFGKAYEVTARLSSMSPDKVLYESLDVFAEMMDHCQAAIWLLNQGNDFARLNACTSGLRDTLPRTLIMHSLPELKRSFDSDGLFINRALDPDYPDLAAPIWREKQVIAFVALYQVKPYNFTLHNQNLFRVLVGLTENSLLYALQYAEKLRSENYLPDTELLRAPELGRRLTLARQKAETAHITLLVLEVHYDKNTPLTKLSDKLSRLMRSGDFAGVDESGRILAALPNARADDFEPIRKRFASAGVEVTSCPLN